ncbi:hypothetical protein MJO28_007218 [Puccinia striiformis f. sp. tritici]|uniref:Uncharacterized protein n=1 Tax=Puccinia striiformis f. sp. tritici TaxID=168172 RepID=A0ACC0EDU1_9BASI|nr:hypothetical protein MJO28_007218 [Puccinia striiformis f. sp. tritici]
MVFVKYAPATKVSAVRMIIGGNSQRFICDALGMAISRQSFNRWLQLYDETQAVLVRDAPGLFLTEIRERLYDSTGTLVSIEAIHQNLVNKLRITLKKADTPVLSALSSQDESAVCGRDVLRTFARSERGRPAVRYMKKQNSSRLSVLPAISFTGVLAMTVRDNTFNAKKFKHFLKWDLLPRMNRYPNKDSILVCDNAAIHRGPRVQRLCDQFGVLIVYLPPYCPELNPIELCFAAMKQNLRDTDLLDRSNNPPLDIRRVCANVMTAEFCASLYRHCGYAVPHTLEDII